MLRTILFLAIESLLLATMLVCGWHVAKRGLSLLGIQLRRTTRLALPAIWTLLFVADFIFTRRFGPSFTTLYVLSGIVIFTATSLFFLCVILRKAQVAKAEKF